MSRSGGAHIQVSLVVVGAAASGRPTSSPYFDSSIDLVRAVAASMDRVQASMIEARLSADLVELDVRLFVAPARADHELGRDSDLPTVLCVVLRRCRAAPPVKQAVAQDRATVLGSQSECSGRELGQDGAHGGQARADNAYTRLDDGPVRDSEVLLCTDNR